MAKHFYAPVVVRTDDHDGHEVIPAPELIDRVCKCQELRMCPVRACIEFIGERQSGFGSRLARGKRYHVQGSKYIDSLYAIQRDSLKWLNDETVRTKGVHTPNPAASLDKKIDEIVVAF